MFCCKKCCKEFKTNWQLQRHLGNKRPCKEVTPLDTSFTPLDTRIPPLDTGICDFSTARHINSSSIWKCIDCQGEFSRKDSLERHREVCPQRNDEVRSLENRLGIKVTIDVSNTKCRFCDIKYSRIGSLHRHQETCKAKEEYKKHLRKLIRKAGAQTINNITNNTMNNSNNTTTNNITVNCIGKEDISYLTCEVIKGILKNTSSDDEFIAKTLAYIHAHEDHPENHNIIYSNMRSNAALVKNRDNYEYKNIDVVLKDAITNWLDNVAFTEKYDRLPQKIKEKYEKGCDDDEMNRTTKSILKLDLYNMQKGKELEGS